MYTLVLESLSPKLYYSSLVSNLTLISTTFVFILILLIVYMSKKNMDNIENKLYRLLIFLSAIELGFYILDMVGDLYWPTNYKLLELTIRVRMTAEMLWFFLINLYRIVIIQYKRKEKFELWFNKNKKAIYATIIIILSFISLLSMTLPMTIIRNSQNPLRHQCEGICYVFWMFTFIILVLIYFILAFLSIGKIEKKKILPFLVNDTFMVSVFFHPVFRDLSIPMVTRSLIVYVMYHTIENPDIKMVNELTLAKNQAERASNAKSDFLSSMSHELRTPLNAIVGLSQMIKDGDNMEDMKTDSEDILIASENLLELVNGILDINQLEANKMELVENNYRPLEIIKDLERMINVRIGDKDLALKTTLSENIPDVLYGDKDKIKRIISNLLTNAVKYTEQGFIYFNVDCENKDNKCTLKITVTDTGRGISKDRIPILFTKFNRLESDKDSDISGTGLGLAITKSLVELLGGKISVESTEGKGSTFTIELLQKIIKEKKNEETPEIL